LKKNEKLNLDYEVPNHMLTEEILKVTRKYYKMIHDHGTIKYKQKVKPVQGNPDSIKLGF
jgi:hypothetical protein